MHFLTGVFTLSEIPHSQLYGWYIVNDYGALWQSEKEHNANLAMTFLRQNGFTIWAAAGIVGNMWAESGLSPDQWEGNTPDAGGYGLVQWTPYTLYSIWAGTDWRANGPKEMERLKYERENGLEFFRSQTYPAYGWTEYAALRPDSTQGQTDEGITRLAASIFLYNYLRPANPAATERNRQNHAWYVFQNCKGNALPAWLLFKMAKLTRRIWY